jgi:hypothetical protein
MFFKPRLTLLERRDTPSAVTGEFVNTGQHGAVVCPGVVRPQDSGTNNKPDTIFMPVQAHGGTAPQGVANSNGPALIFDTIPNETQC